MVCCQAPVIVLFVPFVTEVAQDTAVGLPIDGFLLDVGVGIALLVPEAYSTVAVVRNRRRSRLMSASPALRGFVPFTALLFGRCDRSCRKCNCTSGVVAGISDSPLNTVCVSTAIVGFVVHSKVVCTVNGCCTCY